MSRSGGVDVTVEVIKIECDGAIFIVKQSHAQREGVPADSLGQCALATGAPSLASDRSETIGAKQTGRIDIKSPFDRQRPIGIQRKIPMRIQPPKIGIIKIIAHGVAVLSEIDAVIINTNGRKLNAHGHDFGGHGSIGGQNKIQYRLGDSASLIQFKRSSNGDGVIGLLRGVIGCHQKSLAGWQ